MQELTRWRPGRSEAPEELTLGLLIAERELSAQVQRCLLERPMRVVLELPEVGAAPEVLIDSEVRRAKPDVVMLEVAAAGERFPELIRLLKSRPTPPTVLTIHAVAAPDALLAAIRAGASDCLYLPLEEGALRQALDRVAAERLRTQPQRPPARTVGFLSVTGGCGGTLLACHFASEVRRLSGQSLLVADFDVASGMVGFWLRAANGYSMGDAVRGLQRLDVSLWRGLVAAVQPQLDVISAPPEVASGDIYEPEQLLKVLRFARGLYEWVVADLGAGLTPAAMRLLGEVNTLFVVSTAEVAALYQARRILGKLLTLGLAQERVRLVLNRVHKQQQIRPGEAERALGWQIEAALPHDLESIEEAQGEGRLLSPRSEIGKRIAELAARTVGQAPAEKGGFWASVFRASPAKEG